MLMNALKDHDLQALKAKDRNPEEASAEEIRVVLMERGVREARIQSTARIKAHCEVDGGRSHGGQRNHGDDGKILCQWRRRPRRTLDGTT